MEKKLMEKELVEKEMKSAKFIRSRFVFISISVTLFMSNLAKAEYNRIEARCSTSGFASDRKFDYDRLQIWYTFRAQVGTPQDPYPKQAVYRLFSVNASNHAQAQLAVLTRSSLDLDLRAGDGGLRSVNLTSQDQTYKIALTVNGTGDGQAPKSASGTLNSLKGGTGIGKTLQLQCDQIGPALFQF